MRERPILFNGAMVRAILAGQKTQTRRVVKPAPPASHLWGGWCSSSTCKVDEGKAVWAAGEGPLMHSAHRVACPFGQPGDRLWVRETWRPQTIHSCAMDTCDCDSVGVTYEADGEWIPYTWWNEKQIDDKWCMPEAAARGNVPSIHMPRWACRLLLAITGVRVERLQAISDADALAEGIEELNGRYTHNGGKYECRSPAGAFVQLWESTGGGWDSNPWVWVIEFKRVEAG